MNIEFSLYIYSEKMNMNSKLESECLTLDFTSMKVF